MAVCMYSHFGLLCTTKHATSLLKEEQIWRSLWPCGWDLVLSVQPPTSPALEKRLWYNKIISSSSFGFIYVSLQILLPEEVELRWLIRLLKDFEVFTLACSFPTAILPQLTQESCSLFLTTYNLTLPKSIY